MVFRQPVYPECVSSRFHDVDMESAWRELRGVVRRQKYSGTMWIAVTTLVIAIATVGPWLSSSLVPLSLVVSLSLLPGLCWAVVLWLYGRMPCGVVTLDGTLDLRTRRKHALEATSAVLLSSAPILGGLASVRVATGEGHPRRVLMLPSHVKRRLCAEPQIGASGPDGRWMIVTPGTRTPMLEVWHWLPTQEPEVVVVRAHRKARQTRTLATRRQLIGLYEATDVPSGEEQPVGRWHRPGTAGLVRMLVAVPIALYLYALSRLSLIPFRVPGFLSWRVVGLVATIGLAVVVAWCAIVLLGAFLTSHTAASSPLAYTTGRPFRSCTRRHPWQGATLRLRFRFANRGDHQLQLPGGQSAPVTAGGAELSLVLRHARIGGARIEYNGEVVPPPPWLVEAGAPEVPSSSAAAAMTLDAPAPASEPSGAGDPPPTLD